MGWLFMVWADDGILQIFKSSSLLGHPICYNVHKIILKLAEYLCTLDLNSELCSGMPYCNQLSANFLPGKGLALLGFLLAATDQQIPPLGRRWRTATGNFKIVTEFYTIFKC